MVVLWYLKSLLNVDKTDPGLKESFYQESYCCKKIAKPFSRIPIDLTLEQTINTDTSQMLTSQIQFKLE